jgi:cytoskeletal protein CcmA (bactofilin family)
MDDLEEIVVDDFVTSGATKSFVLPKIYGPSVVVQQVPVIIPAPVPVPRTYTQTIPYVPPSIIAAPMIEQVSSYTEPRSNNLAPDLSTYPSANEPYFQLASAVEPVPEPDTWYEYPTQTGSVLFNNTIPTPVPGPGQGELHALGNSIFYNANSLMPFTWYLNPALNGMIEIIDASGTQVLQSIDGNLYYNNELLAKANDIQDIADWSLYPALASVDFNGNSITGLGDLVATGTADVSGNITAGSLTITGTLAGTLGGPVAAGINTNASGILTSGLSTNTAIPATADSVTTSQILFDICGGTLATDGGGTLLTFNGQAITTGTEGDAANWSSYPAFNDITGITTEPLVVRAPGSQPINIIADNNAINSTTGGAYNVTVDKGINILAAANVNVTAQNGSGGNIQLNAQPGYQLGPEQIGFGAIQLNAYGSSNQALGLGGKIDITAYSGGIGEYGSATSRVSLNAATLALSAGALPAFPATSGSVNILGQDIISIVASVVPPLLGQYPNTVYIFGDGISNVAGGVRLSSPNGVQIADNSEFYATDIFPYTSNGLNLKGRGSFPGPAADVTIADCATFAMRNAATMTGIKSIAMDGSGAITNVATINGVSYPPPVGDVADWSTFPAIQTVDMSGNSLIKVNDISIIPGATILGTGALTLDVSGDFTVLTDGGGEINISSGAAGDIIITAAGAGNDLTLIGDTASLTGAVDTNVTAITGSVVLNAATAISLQAAVTVGTTLAPHDISVNGGITVTADVVSSQGTDNYSLNTIGALVGGIPSGFRDATEFYVSFDGDDTTGLGSILSPYRTIQKAITQAELNSSALQVCVINVASGLYPENLTFNVGFITLNGSLQSQNGNEVCEITGSISINVSGADNLFVRQISFQGFNITCGQTQSVTDTSTAAHTVSFQDCRVFANSVFFNSTTTASDMRLYIANTEINQTNAAFGGSVITTNKGLLDFERMDMALTGNCKAITIGGTSVLNRFSLSTLESTNAAAILQPILAITSTTTSAHSLGNVAFTFSSAVAKTNSDAIFINSGINTAMIMLNCVFTLAGTASSSNFCVGYDGSGSPTLVGVNNTALNVNVLLPQTTSVQSGITQIQYTNLQPPGLATYSSTADQPIAVTGTPQALTYNTTQFNQGTTLLANSRVYANAQGNYALSYSVELFHTGGGVAQTATTFLKKNGTTIANTGRQWSIASGGFQNAATAEFVVSLNAGDYVEVFFSGDTNLSANATAAAGALPAIPSVVFNIKQFR